MTVIMKSKASKCPIKMSCFIVTLAICFLLLRFSQPDYENSINLPTINQKKGTKNQKLQQQDRCSGRYIYMLDLPARFNQQLVINCKTLRTEYNFCPYVENGGFGPRINFNDSAKDSQSWYGTYLFNLEMIFHTRMIQYECLTNNSTLASAIYAPFYAGLEVTRHLWSRFDASVIDSGAKDFTSWVRGQPEWSHLFGWDHFFVSGRMTWDFRRPTYIGPHWGSKLMKLPETRNMTMITVDSSPYADNDFAIPYPTYFHPSSDSEVLEWQQRVRSAKRPYLFSFAGAPRPNIKNSIRGELINQCKEASDQKCNLISCIKSDKANCNRPDHFIKEFMKSDFCLQPCGDACTRRSTFDAILAGCIPVFFHPASAYTQYFWHLPKNYSSYSVFIPEGEIKNGSVRVEEVLSKFSQEEVLEMREEVIKLIPRIIYARTKLEKIEDAFDIAIKGILERIEGFRRQIHEGKDPRSKFPEVFTWKYYLTGKTEKHEWDSFFRNKI